MAEPWRPTHVVTATEAARWVGDRWPDLRDLPVTPLGAGWDNTAYAIGGWVFRFPRRQLAAELLEDEIRGLHALGVLPLPVPRPERYSPASAGPFPYPFAGYRRLPGQTACALRWTHAERARLARPLAAFLRALHATPPTAHFADDTLARSDTARRSRKTLEAARNAVDLGLWADLRAVERACAEALKASPWDGQRTVCHGDLYARHLLVDPQRRLCGVIDWGDLHRGDRALDLSIVYSCLPASARPLFWETYGAVDDSTLARARLKAVHYGVVLATFGHATQDAAAVRIGRDALELSVGCHPGAT